MKMMYMKIYIKRESVYVKMKGEGNIIVATTIEGRGIKAERHRVGVEPR